jgi:hypothetical protein
VFEELERLLTGDGFGSDNPDRILATVLFTDIVDSTAHAARLGDEQWRQLNDRHYAIVRSHVNDAGGYLIQTTGDGTLSMLPWPGVAVRCADAITNAIEPLGIQIRAGVHTGECERTQDNLAGLASRKVDRRPAICVFVRRLGQQQVGARSKGIGRPLGSRVGRVDEPPVQRVGDFDRVRRWWGLVRRGGTGGP